VGLPQIVISPRRPIHVVELQGGHLAGAQPQRRQHQQDRVVALANRPAPVAASQKLGDVPTGRGRPYKMTSAKLRLATASMGQPDTKISELCAELGVTRQTLYRHVSPAGELRPDGRKLLADVGRKPR
jgi:hypothetical protein